MFIKFLWFVSFTFAVLGTVAIASGDHYAHESHGEHEEAKGPHGGRLLQEGTFEIEVTIAEEGIPPEFRVYTYSDKQLIAPEKVSLKIELSRLDGTKDVFRFKPVQNYLKGDGVVVEPHSFDVQIYVKYAGQEYQWSYESYEGRTVIEESAAREASVETSISGPAKVTETVMLYGTVRPNEERVYQVEVPYPGKILKVHYGIGDQVKKGEEIALVQSRETLAKYSVKAPATGIIISRHGNPGELIGEESLLVVAQLDDVWVDFAAFPSQKILLKKGQRVTISGHNNQQQAQATLVYLAPIGSSASQSVLVRAHLANPNGKWVPGLLVIGDVVISEEEVPLAVKVSALQTFRDFTVVFAKFNDTYEVRMLELGRRDANYVEVLSGLKPNIEYVSNNSYLIKADIMKSGASHDH